jgi:hypothetical protein
MGSSSGAPRAGSPRERACASGTVASQAANAATPTARNRPVVI